MFLRQSGLAGILESPILCQALWGESCCQEIEAVVRLDEWGGESVWECCAALGLGVYMRALNLLPTSDKFPRFPGSPCGELSGSPHSEDH